MYALMSNVDMEDALTAILALEENKDASFFAVYDGHGGSCNYIKCMSICQI